jgi:hypothetical protein
VGATNHLTVVNHQHASAHANRRGGYLTTPVDVLRGRCALKVERFDGLKNLEYRAYGLGCRVQSWGFRVQGSGMGV